MHVAHGSLMWIGWLVFLPAGIFLAAHFKHLGVWWFRLHVILQTTAIVIIAASFILIVVTVNFSDAHFANTHTRLGLASVSLLAVTPILGILANKLWKPERTSTPIFPDRIHLFFGYSTLLLAGVTLFYGLAQYGASRTIFGLVAAWDGLVLLVFFLLYTPKARGKLQRNSNSH